MDEHGHCFMMLFEGHPDAYGSEQGGCIKQPPTQTVYENHLYGTKPIGIYCMMPGDFVVWACTDIDVDDVVMATNLMTALKKMGFRPFLETSRSKGYHVWVFFSDKVPAVDARQMMLVAHELASVPVVEVNPKQTTLTKGLTYGNYVRLPYPQVDAGTKRRKMQKGLFKAFTLEEFVWEAYESTASPSLVAEWATRWQPPVVHKPVQRPARTDAAMGKLTRYVYLHGPGENFDRSSTLVRFTRLLHEDGFGSQEAFQFLSDADGRWGKYSDRPDRDIRLQAIVDGVYG